MNWEVVCHPKENGGLGIGHLKEKNLALLRKWLWRFFNENDGLWQSIIHNKYGIDQNGWDCSQSIFEHVLAMETNHQALSVIPPSYLSGGG